MKKTKLHRENLFHMMLVNGLEMKDAAILLKLNKLGPVSSAWI